MTADDIPAQRPPNRMKIFLHPAEAYSLGDLWRAAGLEVVIIKPIPTDRSKPVLRFG